MEKMEDEQLEEFEVNEQVLNNLESDEVILYQLKTIKRSSYRKWNKKRLETQSDLQPKA